MASNITRTTSDLPLWLSVKLGIEEIGTYIYAKERKGKGKGVYKEEA